jgi:invasion protein IalB
MDHRLVIAPARPAARAFAIAAATTMLTSLIGSGALAQAPPAPPPAAPAPAAPKAVPKAAPKAAPAQKPAEAPAPQGQPQAQAGDQPQLIFSPWTKFCLKGQEANAKQVCFTGKDGRVESGMPVVAAVLIEPENEPKKVLRVTLPLGMSIQPGTRVIVDNGQPMTGPYVICFNNGCMADYEASGELIGKLKKGQGLVIQGINGAGQPISLVVPLTDFAKAYDGPPTDPKKFEEQQKQLQDELQKRAEDARKKLEGQQAAPTR